MKEPENEMKKLYGEMQNTFYIINSLLDTLDFKSNDEYKRININNNFRISPNFR
mgnify:CR=1 FL=1